MSREEYYEDCYLSMGREEFSDMFGYEDPQDPRDFDFDFNNVKWNMALEYAYQGFIMGLYEWD